MKYHLARPATLLALVIATGCVTRSGPLPPLELTEEMAVDYTERINVALADEIKDRVETLVRGSSGFLRFKTGDVWKTVFIGKPDKSTAVVHIVDSKFEHEIIAAGFASQYTYTVNAVLKMGEKEVALTAKGVNTTVQSTLPKRWEAVHLAVASIAQQANDVIRIVYLTTASTPRLSVAERLEELSRLLKSGLMSENEYESKRQELLKSL